MENYTIKEALRDVGQLHELALYAPYSLGYDFTQEGERLAVFLRSQEEELERLRAFEQTALPLWNHIGCAGCCGNFPKATCEREYIRFIDALWTAVRHANEKERS